MIQVPYGYKSELPPKIRKNSIGSKYSKHSNRYLASSPFDEHTNQDSITRNFTVMETIKENEKYIHRKGNSKSNENKYRNKKKLIDSGQYIQIKRHPHTDQKIGTFLA